MADTTFGDMQNRIADELGGRTDLLSAASGLSTSPIALAILDAVSFYQNNRFYFNEYRTAAAFSTVKGQEFYTSDDWADIATLSTIDKMSILISGNRYWMEPRTAQYMEDISINPNVTGPPSDFGYYNEQIRYYPIPDNAYPVNILGTRRFAALSATGDSNVWTVDAEPMIRAKAKQFLYRDTLRNDEASEAMRLAAELHYKSLKGETFQRNPARKFRASYF